MQNPLLSFLTGFLIWLFLVTAFSYTIFKNSQQPQESLEIDAASFGEIIQEKQIAKDSEIPKPDLDKSSDLKKDEQKKLTHEHHLSDKVVKAEPAKTTPLFFPLPKIPDDLREEAFKSEAMARFYIASDGSVLNVELIKPCANPRLNRLLLESLKLWKFTSGASDRMQDVQGRFEVT